MAKSRTVYVCQSCSAQHSKWQGRCSQCKSWNSLVEEVITEIKQTKRKSFGQSASVVNLVEISKKKKTIKRYSAGTGEMDRVLGGGIVPGSVVLVAGEPGIGKRTLLAQLTINQVLQDKKVLYVCGEESPDQVALRVGRLKKAARLKGKNFLMLAETNVDVVRASAEQERPDLIVVDSIQTLFTADLSGMAGSVGQVRESANRLISYAKKFDVPVFIVGHVTKEGSIAGPKVLEHMVDSVLTIEGEKNGMWRILRAYKNRFGPTDEVGVFAMSDKGMEDVENPSGAFLEESQAGRPGSAVIALMEGTRPVLVEVQALVVQSQLAVPRRVPQGIPVNKLQLICAVLQKHCKLPLGSYDVFVNVAGGLRVNEPAADLGVAMAVASSFKGKALPEKSVVIGEVGLLGEVRQVPMLKKRASEARKMGYKKIIAPDKVRRLSVAVSRILK